jgi:hypothetical protein
VELQPVSTRSERLKTAGAAAALFAWNAAITPRLFFLEYSREMGSIEAAFIGLARYIRDHFPHLGWFPLWYGGIPYPDTYPPLLHWIVALAATTGRVSPALAYHAVTAAVYALAPAALFWAAWRLGASRAAAFVAALGYSLISPACFLSRQLRADAGGWFGPRRLVALLRYGEGPHLLSLLLLPFAVGMLHVALEKRKPLYYFGAALALAAVALSNWLGSFALALMVCAYLLARWDRQWVTAAALGCWAYAIAMPWLAPSTIATIRANAPLVNGKFESGPGHKIYAAVFAGGLVLLAWAMRRAKWPARIRFALLFLFGTAAIVLPSYWFDLALVPQPFRYHLEMDLAFWLTVALLIPLRPRAAMPAAWIAVALGLPVLLHQHSMARRMEQPIRIESTVEYHISRWMGAHMPGRRVFAPGTIGFWMNAFSDTPMLTGGFDNGMRNVFLQDVNYQIYFGDQQKTALDWLQAYGCDAVIGGGPQSREVYHPYNHPAKLEGLPELWREGGDVIYAVPRSRHSLAHAVLAADLPSVTPRAYDTGPLAPYLAALEDPARPVARFRWTGPGSASIVANLPPEYLLSVQVTWDKGWHAQVNGQTRRVWGDKLGQMVVEPRCSGPCTVELNWDGGAEMRAAQTLCGGALAGGVIWILLWRKRLGSVKTN